MDEYTLKKTIAAAKLAMERQGIRAGARDEPKPERRTAKTGSGQPRTWGKLPDGSPIPRSGRPWIRYIQQSRDNWAKKWMVFLPSKPGRTARYLGQRTHLSDAIELQDEAIKASGYKLKELIAALPPRYIRQYDKIK